MDASRYALPQDLTLAELRELQENDLAIRAQIGLSYEAYEMPRLVYRSG
jgi:hypothetical protein